MSVTHTNQSPDERKKRRLLSPEKKFQIFLESHTGETPVGELLRREGIYSTDLARIREKVRQGALERLADRPGAKKKTVSQAEYDTLKSVNFGTLLTMLNNSKRQGSERTRGEGVSPLIIDFPSPVC